MLFIFNSTLGYRYNDCYLVLLNDPMNKFGYESLNFVRMFTLAINAKKEKFAFSDNI